MKEYLKYKPSGVEWIGDIPCDWDKLQVKILFSIGRGRVISQEELLDDGLYPVFSSQTKNNGCLGYINTYDFDCKQITWTTDGNAGTIFLREGKHNCTNVCGTLQLKNCNYSLKFFMYLLQYLTAYYKRPDINGAKIMNNEMARIVLCVPPAIEQKRIADFLDDKTEKIDVLISDKEKLIKLLKEYRQSIISETVTKGLDKKVQMKPSGIDWIGDIPQNWEIKKLKCIAELYPKYRVSSVVKDMDVTFSPMECVKAGILEQRLSKFSNYNSSYNIFKNGDILMAKLTCCFENRNIVIAKDLSNGIGFGSSELFVIRCFGVNKEYMFYYFQNNAFMETAKSTMQGVTLKRISADFIKNSQTPLPGREEQKKIVSYLNDKTSQIDNLIEDITKQIEKLQEYRKSIISETVTGKAAA